MVTACAVSITPSSYLVRLVVPPVRLSTGGSRAFPVVAAQIWNSLPEHIVSAPTLQFFRRHLKTFFTATIFLVYSTLVDLVVISVTLATQKKSLID